MKDTTNKLVNKTELHKRLKGGLLRWYGAKSKNKKVRWENLKNE